MKRIIMILIIITALSSPSYSALKQYGNIALEIPNGWAARQIDNTLALTKDDQSASMSITTGAMEGKELSEVAQEFAKKNNGTEPIKNINGGYEFSFNEKTSQAVISGDDKSYMLIVMTNIKNAPDDFMNILKSMRLIVESNS